MNNVTTFRHTRAAKIRGLYTLAEHQAGRLGVPPYTARELVRSGLRRGVSPAMVAAITRAKLFAASQQVSI